MKGEKKMAKKVVEKELGFLVSSGKCIFDVKKFAKNSVLTFTCTIRDIYNARNNITVDNAQRNQSNVMTNAKRFFATMLYMCASVMNGDTKLQYQAIKKFFDINKRELKGLIVEGGSPTEFTFTLSKNKKKVMSFNNKDSAHRVVYITKIINDEIPIPHSVKKCFIGTNQFLEDFWAMQNEDTLYFSDLPTDIQEMFLNSPVIIHLYDTDDERFKRDIFQIRNDSVPVKSHESMNNAFTGLSPFYDFVEVFAGIIKNDEKTFAKYPGKKEKIEKAIPATQIDYIREMFRYRGAKMDAVRNVIERTTLFGQLDGISGRPWCNDSKDAISSEVFERNKNLSEKESLALLKTSCKLLYDAANMFASKDEVLETFGGRFGLLNAAEYELITQQLEGLAFGKSLAFTARELKANKNANRKRLLEIKRNDINNDYSKMETGTYHSFEEARAIKEILFKE